jgi:hypothetical protein
MRRPLAPTLYQHAHLTVKARRGDLRVQDYIVMYMLSCSSITKVSHTIHNNEDYVMCLFKVKKARRVIL